MFLARIAGPIRIYDSASQGKFLDILAENFCLGPSDTANVIWRLFKIEQLLNENMLFYVGNEEDFRIRNCQP